MKERCSDNSSEVDHRTRSKLYKLSGSVFLQKVLYSSKYTGGYKLTARIARFGASEMHVQPCTLGTSPSARTRCTRFEMLSPSSARLARVTRLNSKSCVWLTPAAQPGTTPRCTTLRYNRDMCITAKCIMKDDGVGRRRVRQSTTVPGACAAQPSDFSSKSGPVSHLSQVHQSDASCPSTTASGEGTGGIRNAASFVAFLLLASVGPLLKMTIDGKGRLST